MKSNIINKNKGLQFVFTWILLFFASILVRLPQILSNNFWFDGDEAMIGIMAKKLLTFEEFPVYFSGQNYGFSTLEVFSTSIFELLLGSGALTLFLGGILLFSLACTFVYMALKQKMSNKALLYAVLIILIIFPTWYLFAGKVRGGYVTAFLGISILLYYLSKPQLNFADFIVIGIWLGITFESHSLILIGFSPIGFIEIIKRKISLKEALTSTVSMLLVIFLIRYFGSVEDPIWLPPEISLDNHFLQFFTLQFYDLQVLGFTGLYYYSMPLEFSSFWEIMSVVLFLIMLAFIIKQSLRKNEKGGLFLFFIIIISILYFAFVILLGKQEPRYLLGLYTGLLFWFVYLTPYITGKIDHLFLLITLIISVIGITNASKYVHCWYLTEENEQEIFEEFYQAVKSTNAEGIFLTDALLQWRWNYLYGNEIPGTCFYKRERIQDYDVQVDSLSIHYPEKVIIGGFYGVTMGIEAVSGFNDGIIQINSKYFIQPAFKMEYKEMADSFLYGN